MAKFVTNAEGNFFVQLTRGSVFEWLTCTGIGDVDIPQGERTPVYCPDPANSGYFQIEGFVRGDAGAGTYSITKPITTVYNFLLDQNCAYTGRINWVCRGLREDPRNFEMAALLIDSEMSRKGIGNPVRGPEDTEARVNTNADVSFIYATMIYPLTLNRQSLVNTVDANAIYFLPERCEDRCGAARGLCTEGVMGMDRGAGYLYDSELKYTTDGGSNWAAAAVDPFTWGGNIGDVLILETVIGERILAARGEAVAAAPPEVAYSDDWGASWTNLTVGAVVNIGINRLKMNEARVFACMDGGYIWYTANQGVGWVNVENAVETVQNLNDMAFYDNYGYCVGNSNVVLRSVDSGASWDSITGPAVAVNMLSCEVNDKGHLFVGTNDGRLFRSEDQGDNWTEWVDHTSGSIDWIGREELRSNGYVMAYIYNNATPVGSLYRSDDGGATWWEIPNMPTNAGLNGGYICDPNNIFVCGNAQGGTSFVAKASPS